MVRILQNRVALITGGARGIGKAIALKLAEEGADIAVFDIQEGAALSGEIEKKGVNFGFWEVDIRNFAQVEKCVSEVKEKFGNIHILVNNAGITRDNLLVRMREEEWDQVIEINLKGAFNCSRCVVKVMMKQKEGCIVNIASVVGMIGNTGQANYSASKGGLIAFTKSLAKELARWGIRVNAVAPGFIQSAMTEKLSPQAREKMLADIPMDRIGLPEEVADSVFFLSSPLSSYITGEVVRVDGGMAI
ncbi:MAG: 3-oxoacyl-[acyl-carrier-protein] reductase [Caldiserica bacterium]|nr:3-oxoacyl-[acyl-carrier-protein] reductase [Caldisericota bacterium]